MIVQFSIIPVGEGSSISGDVAKVLKIVDESGLPYRLNPMATVVEGSWREVMDLIQRCHEEIMGGRERVLTSITIDDRRDRTDMINQKIQTVERKTGKPLNK